MKQMVAVLGWSLAVFAGAAAAPSHVSESAPAPPPPNSRPPGNTRFDEGMDAYEKGERPSYREVGEIPAADNGVRVFRLSCVDERHPNNRTDATLRVNLLFLVNGMELTFTPDHLPERRDFDDLDNTRVVHVGQMVTRDGQIEPADNRITYKIPDGAKPLPGKDGKDEVFEGTQKVAIPKDSEPVPVWYGVRTNDRQEVDQRYSVVMHDSEPKNPAKRRFSLLVQTRGGDGQFTRQICVNSGGAEKPPATKPAESAPAPTWMRNLGYGLQYLGEQMGLIRPSPPEFSVPFRPGEPVRGTELEPLPPPSFPEDRWPPPPPPDPPPEK